MVSRRQVMINRRGRALHGPDQDGVSSPVGARGGVGALGAKEVADMRSVTCLVDGPPPPPCARLTTMEKQKRPTQWLGRSMLEVD